MLPIRKVSRIVVLDSEGAVLLVRYDSMKTQETWWVPPGGALEPGEDHRMAAGRELVEETGLSANIGTELWECRFDITHEAIGTVHQIERYFLVTLDSVAPHVHNSSPEDIAELRWWHPEDVAASSVAIYPEDLAGRLAGLSEL